jgi:hypothetical protein
MTKENLILVHSFPTNSILLRGLTEFLEDYFTVYFVDLPGFNTSVPAIKNISFDAYAHYVDEYIGRVNLKSYILGGISFGFPVINNCRITEQCRGILAIEPYINATDLNQGFIDKYTHKIICAIISFLKLHSLAYRSRAFKKYLLSHNPAHRIETVLQTIDPYAFFETARIILNYDVEPTFKKKPYVLVINTKDDTIAAQKIIQLFETIDKALIIRTTSEHYPEHPTKEYFQKSISDDDMKNILSFFRYV